jgi:hypothetical protein
LKNSISVSPGAVGRHDGNRKIRKSSATGANYHADRRELYDKIFAGKNIFLFLQQKIMIIGGIKMTGEASVCLETSQATKA